MPICLFQRLATLDAALALVDACTTSIWPLEAQDVRLARALIDRHPALSARDLLHLACCKRREVHGVKTFDRGLADAFPLLFPSSLPLASQNRMTRIEVRRRRRDRLGQAV
jgi:hypothetical protein